MKIVNYVGNKRVLIIVNVVSQSRDTDDTRTTLAHSRRDYRSEERERERVIASAIKRFNYSRLWERYDHERKHETHRRTTVRPRRSNVIRLSILARQSVTCPRTVAPVIAIIISGGARAFYRQLFPTGCKNKRGTRPDRVVWRGVAWHDMVWHGVT